MIWSWAHTTIGVIVLVVIAYWIGANYKLGLPVLG